MGPSFAEQTVIPTSSIFSSTTSSTPRTNGFVERFHRTALDEFFRTAFRTKFYDTVEALQKDLDEWLNYYNNQRPHQGYRNMGKRPIDTTNKYLESIQIDD
jgi:hypothetical protein